MRAGPGWPSQRARPTRGRRCSCCARSRMAAASRRGAERGGRRGARAACDGRHSRPAARGPGHLDARDEREGVRVPHGPRGVAQRRRAGACGARGGARRAAAASDEVLSGLGKSQRCRARWRCTARRTAFASRVLKERGVGADTVRRLARAGPGVSCATSAASATRSCLRPSAAGWPRHDGGAAPGSRTLTAEQADAFARLRRSMAARRFHVALLHGVTGSGKTELYLRMAAEARGGGAAGAGARARDRADAGGGGACSGTRSASASPSSTAASPTASATISGTASGTGTIDIVVGTRSAVFAPLDGIGLSSSTRSTTARTSRRRRPRYNGRDSPSCARAQAHALVVLGSATPSMESYRTCAGGPLRRSSRWSSACSTGRSPRVRVVNMRDEHLRSEGPDVVLSAALAWRRSSSAWHAASRRCCCSTGAASRRRCSAGSAAPRSTARTAASRSPFTGAREGAPRRAATTAITRRPCRRRARTCAAPYLEHVGFGTERVEAEVQRLLPAARVARVDRDTMQRRGAIQAVLARFARGEIDVIVGTQMIAKGHDFPARHPRRRHLGRRRPRPCRTSARASAPSSCSRRWRDAPAAARRRGRGDRADALPGALQHPARVPPGLPRPSTTRRFAFRRAMRYPPMVALINAIVRAPCLRARDGRRGGPRGARARARRGRRRSACSGRRRRRSAGSAASTARRSS